jgi:hypothetical protein
MGEIKLSLKVGDMITFERTFTAEDVELFTKVSGDVEYLFWHFSYVQIRMRNKY